MDTVRAWKDPEYRHSLGPAAPDHPVGDPAAMVLGDDELDEINGAGTNYHETTGCCSCNPAWSASWGIWRAPPPNC